MAPKFQKIQNVAMFIVTEKRWPIENEVTVFVYKNDFNELGFVARGGGVFLFLKFKESNSRGWGHHAINQFVHTSPLVLVSLLWIVYNHFLDVFFIYIFPK